MASPKKASNKLKKTKMKSFELSPDHKPFMSFRVTDQTIYWSILLILVLLLGVWVLNIQINLSDILDSVK